jgi:uncharacterized membrane protein (DUF2068 family)
VTAETPSDSPAAISVGLTTTRQRAPALYLIIAAKLLKGLLLLLLAVGVYMLRDKNLSNVFDSSLRFIHIDPERRFFVSIGEALGGISPQHVKAVAVWTSLYGLLLVAESVGLAIRARWAVWLAIGQSAFFIPIEYYKYFQNGSMYLLVLLAFNIAILWYLMVNRHRLFRTRL